MNSWARKAVFHGIITYYNGVMSDKDLSKRERATMRALAASTGYVRRMSDGRWEVTAEGWKHHNAETQRQQAYEEGLVDILGHEIA